MIDACFVANASQFQAFSAWQAHTLRHRSAADLVKLMVAVLDHWAHMKLARAVNSWKRWVRAQRKAHRKAFQLFERQ